MFALEIFSNEEKKVRFYTVKEIDAVHSETENFLRRIYESEHKQSLYELTAFIFEEIGNKRGSKEYFFNRFENRVTALPPKKVGRVISLAKTNEISFDLFNIKIRLYCLRLSDSVVVLFNGGIKLSNLSAQNDSGVSMHFHNANKYAQRILEAINDGTICVTYRSMVASEGKNNEIIL